MLIPWTKHKGVTKRLYRPYDKLFKSMDASKITIEHPSPAQMMKST